MWKKIGVCPDFECDERLWHAGLSQQGTRCLIAGFDDNVYIVWDIAQAKVIWKSDASTEEAREYPLLQEWVDDDGYVAIEDGSAAGRYRVFGLNTNHARTVDDSQRLSLRVNLTSETLDIQEIPTGRVIQALKYEAFSGDWAFASFSENGKVIAVIEPYFVTFFGKLDAGRTEP